MSRTCALLLAAAASFGTACGVADADQPSVKPQTAVSGDTAILSWSAFECALYAEMAGEPQTEQERLFLLGYENGKAFIDAARRGAISEEERRTKVPIGFAMRGGGPTADFAIGRVYEAVTTAAYDRIVKHDFSGDPLPAGKWLLDAEVKKTRAGTEYSTRNCKFLK